MSPSAAAVGSVPLPPSLPPPLVAAASEPPDELALVEGYLSIEKARFEERLEVRVRCAPEVREALVPTLILQPLAENAVRHGLANERGSGLVEVDAERRGEQLLLTVADNGIGLNGTRCKSGIGLSNTRRRLEEHYGLSARVLLEDRPGGGTRAEILLQRLQLTVLSCNLIAELGLLFLDGLQLGDTLV